MNSSETTLKPIVQNIVATVDLCVKIDNLEIIAQKVNNAEYNPQRFAAVIMRIREPKTTALVFRTGKMVVTGAKSLNASKVAARKYVSIINKAGFNAVFSEAHYKVQNMTATVTMGFPIRLEALIYAYPNISTYEPELFPGLIFRMQDPKVVFLVFVSGKVVVTGVKSEEIIVDSIKKLYNQLQPFRKSSVLIQK